GLSGRGTSPYWGKYEGLFTNRSRNTLGQVPDGTSQTLLLGEYDGGRMDGQRHAHGSWIAVGAMPTCSGLPPDGGGPFVHAASFGSRHPGVVQFCLADGSVRGLRKGTSWVDWWDGDLAALFPNSYPADWWVLQELSGMRDGGTRPVLGLTD